MTNLKMPSKTLKIVGGPYKGYDAELVERSGNGRDFLMVNVAAVGSFGTIAKIPTQYVIFVMEDGRLLRYTTVHENGLSLTEVGKEDSGKIIKVTESIDSPSRGLPLFFPNQYLADTEIDSFNVGEHSEISLSGEHQEIDYEDENEEESSEGPMFVDNYNDIFRTCRDAVILDNSDTTEYISDILQILGFHMDNTSLNIHSKILRDALKSPVLKGVDLENEDILKSFVMAYVFIHINNMCIGYPIIFPHIKMRPNDDSKFITEVAQVKKFTKVIFNIEGQIAALAAIMQTKIIPSSENVISGIGSRFGLLRLSDKTKKVGPIISNTENKLKMLKLGFNLKQTEIKAKDVILNKVEIAINKTSDEISKRMLKNFKDNFNKYIKGHIFMKLKNNPDLVESKVIFPFIKEYKKRVEIEEEKFYKNPSVATLNNACYKGPFEGTEDFILRKRVVSDLNSEMQSAISKNGDTDDDKFLQYIIKNSDAISKMTITDLKKLKASKNTSSEYEKKKIEAIIEYRHISVKIFNDYKNLSSEKIFDKKRQNYKLEQASKKLENINIKSKKAKVSIKML